MSDLDRLLYWRGVAADFYNYRGELTQVPLENRLQLLAAMGVETNNPEAIAQEAYELDIKPWLSWLPKLEVVDAQSAFADLNFQPEELSQEITWSLDRKGASVSASVFIPEQLEEVGDYLHGGKRYSRRRLALGQLEPDYYQLSLKSNSKKTTCTIAAVPATAWLPEWSKNEGANPWGLLLQLYTLRSKTNWGIGDFSDLLQLIEHSAKAGVDVIGLNPFHALQVNLKHDYSPYNPSDRRFLNALYIDVTAVDGFNESFVDQADISLLRDAAVVDFEAQRALKYSALWQCFNASLSSGDLTGLVDYVQEADESLFDFVNYQLANNWAPEEQERRSGERSSLLSWLGDTERPSELMLFAFYTYIQWHADTQFELCQQVANKQGMKLGLVRDLAVGANGGGAEVQTSGRLFCHDASVGAPPDPLALSGQNWGLPPMDPAELRHTGFAHFINLLRSNMTHCGALRIDHAMSLYRLWWCPPGATADKGAYVYYPFRELLGLLCLESYLHKCVVIAEDLGIVPEEFSREMQRCGLYSNKVFYFEKYSDTQFKHPRDYTRHALAMLNNHDVPTIVSWWNGSDLILRDSLNLLGDNNTLEAAQSLRQAERKHLLELLEGDAYLPEGWQLEDINRQADETLVDALLLFASQAASQFFMLQLEDLMMMDAPVNVPGTYLEHDNWSRKLLVDLEDVFATERLQKLFAEISEKRNSL
ncbi:4-alpha-glucanotransferase [Agaribacterium sp. ZY112]|uniref:4-alpha-glucanotransferase n=1 Tax=Agaribacterium sp. ZY112 TaxID=3233574 RepID=UPI0035261546